MMAAVVLCACGAEDTLEAPPLERLYYPAGLSLVGATDADAGTLYVASSNFDKRFDFGAVTAIALDDLAWPEVSEAGFSTRRPPYLVPGPSALGRPTTPAAIEDLKVTEDNRVIIAPFAGIIDVHARADGSHRIFVPTRAEGDNLYAVDANGAALTCMDPGEGRTCNGMSLTQPAEEAGSEGADGFVDGKPRAPEPYAAQIRKSDGRVFVTHLQQADSPISSQQNREAFLVELDAENPQVTASSFIPIGPIPAVAVAPTERFLWITGRRTRNVIPPALRFVDTSAKVVAEAGVQQDFRIVEARSVVLHEDADVRRLFLVGRSPDTLLAFDLGDDLNAPNPVITQSVLLPDGPNDAKIIRRGPGRGPLVAVTCTEANALAIYDDETGQLATVVLGVGQQPFSIAVDRLEGAKGARLYVSNFGDGRIAVIDIPDLDQPNDAFIAAHLGRSQECLTGEQGTPGCEAEVAQ